MELAQAKAKQQELALREEMNKTTSTTPMVTARPIIHRPSRLLRLRGKSLPGRLKRGFFRAMCHKSPYFLCDALAFHQRAGGGQARDHALFRADARETHGHVVLRQVAGDHGQLRCFVQKLVEP